MSLLSPEPSVKKEPQQTDLRSLLSPLTAFGDPYAHPSPSPTANDYYMGRPRTTISHDTVRSPFNSPFSGTAFQSCRSPEPGALHMFRPALSPFASALRRNSMEEKREPEEPGQKIQQTPQFAAANVHSGRQPRPICPISVSPQDIDELRLNILFKAASHQQAKTDEKRDVDEGSDDSEMESESEGSKEGSVFEEVRPVKRRQAERATKDTGEEEAGEMGLPFKCKYCEMHFAKAQALGGHMSRKHPGKSREYNYKKNVRKKREIERLKLYLAKKKYFSTLSYDYDDLIKTVEGRMRARSLMNRTKVKRIKRELSEDEVNKFADSQILIDEI